jgi:hypothetical protein
VRACRQAKQWCEWKGGCCCGWQHLGQHVPHACLGSTFHMMSDKCGNGAAGDKGSATSKVLSGGSMVARTDGVTVVMMGG